MKVQLWATEQKPLRLELFQPLNNTALLFICGDGELTQYGLPMDKAWAMFDLWGDASTIVSDTKCGTGSFRVSAPDAPARLAKLRAETMGQPVPESEAA